MQVSTTSISDFHLLPCMLPTPSSPAYLPNHAHTLLTHPCGVLPSSFQSQVAENTRKGVREAGDSAQDKLTGPAKGLGRKAGNLGDDVERGIDRAADQTKRGVDKAAGGSKGAVEAAKRTVEQEAQ